MKKYLLIIALFFFFFDAFAQKNINVTVNNKRYDIPEFKQDSVQSYMNKFVKDGIVAPITESGAVIEIRFFGEKLYRGKSGRMVILQYYPDTVVFKEISYVYMPYETQSDSLYKFIGKNSEGFYIGKANFPLAQKKDWDSVFNELLKNKAFSLPNYSTVLHNLKNPKVTLKNFPKEKSSRHFIPDEVLEIKAQNYYRNIFIKADYDANNEEIPEFKCAENIAKIFNSLFNNLNFGKQ